MMMSDYFIDTAGFSMDKFRNILKTRDILPGRILLKEKIDERFDQLKSYGIHTLRDFLESVKSKSSLEQLAKETGLPVEYLTILKREVGSYLSGPVKLSDFPLVDPNLVKELVSLGISNSRQLFELASKKNSRKVMADKISQPVEKLTELVGMCDLVRITGVGPVFARIIYESGIHSIKQFLSINAKGLLQKLSKTNEDLRLTKVRFTEKDIAYCIEFAKELPLVLEE
jgi:hypothetical protein